MGFRSRMTALPRGDDRGAVAVFFAFVSVLLTTIAALAVDVADAETEVRANQSRVDFAALAAGASLPGDPLTACRDAWSYLRANTPGLPPTAVSPCESGVPAIFSPSCEEGTMDAVTYEALGDAPYEITFTYPVTDDHPAMESRVGDNDGRSCERLAINVATSRPSVFSGVFGFTSLRVRVSSVVRGFQDASSEAPTPLVVFDPTGCEPLLAQGQGGIKVFPQGANTGWIGVDSDGSATSCTPSDAFTVDADGSQTRIASCGVGSTISPERCLPGGAITIHAFAPGQSTCSGGNPSACDPSDVTNGRVFPQPARLVQRLTRAAMDHRYNCRSAYPDYLGIVPIKPCAAAGSRPPFIDELRAAMGTTGLPAGFTEYTASACDTTASGDPIVIPAGNWWVNCPEFVVKRPVTFLGGNVVFQGTVNLTSQGSLSINGSNPNTTLPANCLTALCPTQSSAGHAFVHIRANGSTSSTTEGLIRSGQAPLTLSNVFVYIHESGNKGYVNLQGGTGAFSWTAPVEGPFEDLALWSESNREHLLAGSSGQSVEGTMFMPLANPFRYTGQGSQVQTKAQFLSYRVVADGQGMLLMQVDPDRATQFPFKAALLIR